MVVAALFTNSHIFSWQRRSTHRPRKNILRKLATLRRSMCACFILSYFFFFCHFQIHGIVNNLFHVIPLCFFFFPGAFSPLSRIPLTLWTFQYPLPPFPAHDASMPTLLPPFFTFPVSTRHLYRLTLPIFLVQNLRTVTCFI